MSSLSCVVENDRKLGYLNVYINVYWTHTSWIQSPERAHEIFPFSCFCLFLTARNIWKKFLDVLVLLYITAFVYVNNRFACVVVKMENCSVVNVVIDFIVVFLKLSFFVLLMLLGALFIKTLWICGATKFSV